jgi:hypothetical protein
VKQPTENKGENTMPAQPATKQVQSAVNVLSNFINRAQLTVLVNNCRGGEGRFFRNKLVEMAETIKTAPVTYQTDGLGDLARVVLHYFRGNQDWYITERDIETQQHQAFGLADLGEGYPETGYISIVELIRHGVELDLYWTPRTLAEVKAKIAA